MTLRGSFLFTLFCVYVVSVNGLHLPSYIKACNPKDANFKECALKSANDAIPSIVKGDRAFGVPSFYPFKIPFLSLSISGFVLNGTNVEISGIPALKVTDIDLNLDERTMLITIFDPLITLDMDYKMRGKFLSWPSEGDGRAKYEIYDGIYKFGFTYKIKENHGKRFLVISEEHTELEPGKITFHYDNLFNGDKILGEQVLKFANENWRDVYNEAGAPIIDVLKSVFKSIIGAFIEKIPIDEIFPESGL